MSAFAPAATGVELIAALNADVKKIIAKADADGKADVSTECAKRPLSVLWSGYPIYQSRWAFPVYLYAAISLASIANGLLAYGPAVSLLSMVLMFFTYDVYSGVLHVVFDAPNNIALPIMGQPCLEFQWHHHIPRDLVRKNFIDCLGDLNMVGLITFLGYLLLSDVSSNTLLQQLLGMKLLMGYFGQYAHKSAHDVNGRSAVARFLQSAGWMASVAQHKSHHMPPHDTDFCLIGVMDPVITLARSITTNETVWLIVFTAWSVFDLVIMEQVVRATLPGLSWESASA